MAKSCFLARRKSLSLDKLYSMSPIYYSTIYENLTRATWVAGSGGTLRSSQIMHEFTMGPEPHKLVPDFTESKIMGYLALLGSRFRVKG